MKFNIKSLLHDKNVLYIVAFLASMNILSYLIAGNYESIVFFGVVGYLATYFSKNMIVILLISMLTTNLLLGTRMLKRNVESMTTKRKEEEKAKTAKEARDSDVSATQAASAKAAAKAAKAEMDKIDDITKKLKKGEITQEAADEAVKEIAKNFRNISGIGSDNLELLKLKLSLKIT